MEHTPSSLSSSSANQLSPSQSESLPSGRYNRRNGPGESAKYESLLSSESENKPKPGSDEVSDELVDVRLNNSQEIKTIAAILTKTIRLYLIIYITY